MTEQGLVLKAKGQTLLRSANDRKVNHDPPRPELTRVIQQEGILQIHTRWYQKFP